VFFMISMQCMATVAVAKREFGNSKTPLLMLVIYCTLGYFGALIAVQGLRLFGIS
jgi:Fe2+ transport system protein B